MTDLRPLRSAFDSSLVPMIILDDERRSVDVNFAASLHLRASAEEMRGRHIDDLVASTVREELPDVAPGRHLCAWVPDIARENPTRDGAISEREREVLYLVAQGASVEDIAARLIISPNTVRTHIRNARLKLGAGSRAHAVALALTSGLMSRPV